MAPNTLLTSAQQGDPQAIATLINRALESQGITVAAHRDEQGLYLQFQAPQPPDPRHLVPFVHRGLVNLHPKGVTRVTLSGQALEDRVPQWQEELDLAQESRQPAAVGVAQGAMASGRTHAAIAESPSTAKPVVQGETYVRGGTYVSAHIGTLEGQQVAIGHKITQITNHGGIVNLNQQTPKLKLRPAPIATLYCRPFSQLLDRQLETKQAIAALQANQSVAIYGEDGLGKTVLLRALAHQAALTPQFPDGIVYHRAHRQPVADLLQTLFDDFYEFENHIPVKATEADIRQGLHQKQAIAFLDDLDGERQDVEALLNTLPSFTFVLAAQHCCLWSEGEAIALPGLPSGEALMLVERQLGRSLTANEQADAIALCELLRGHPFRILQTVARVRLDQRSLAQEVQQLRIAASPDQPTLQEIGTLPESERRVLAVMATLNGTPLAKTHLAALASPPAAAIPSRPSPPGSSTLDPALHQLLDRGLIQQVGDRYSLAPNLILPLQQAWDLTHWGQQICTYFTNWTTQSGRTSDHLLEAADSLLQAWDWAVQHQHWTEALQLSRTVDSVLFLNKRWEAARQLVDRSLQVAQLVGDRTTESWALHQLGTQALCLDDPFTAHTYLSEALRIREELGEHAAAAVTRHNLNLLFSTLEQSRSERIASEPSSIRPWLIRGLIAGLVVGGGIGLVWVLRPPSAIVAVNPAGSAAANTVFEGLELLQPPSPAIDLRLNPQEINFGTQAIGTAGSAVVPVVVTNQGAAQLILPRATLMGDRADQFQIVADGCAGAPLGPDESCRIDLKFVPTRIGEQQVRLVIPTPGDPTGAPAASISLQGEGTEAPAAARLRLSQTALDFGEREMGQVPGDPQRLSLSNTGDRALTINGLQLTGDHPENFRLVQNSCQDRTLNPNGPPCTIEVQFVPGTIGDRRARLQINHTAAENPAIVTLTGIGVAPQAPAIELGRSVVNFGEVELDAGSDRQDIRIRNTGSAPLQINAVTLGGDQASDFEIVHNGCSGGVLGSADEFCSVVLRFVPTAEGNRRAALAIEHNAASSPATVALEGFGYIPAPPVEILEFYAKPDSLQPGQEAALCFGVANATSIEIEPTIGFVEPSSSNCVSVTPAETTTYTLIVAGANGSSDARSVTVTVAEPEPESPSFTTLPPFSPPVRLFEEQGPR